MKIIIINKKHQQPWWRWTVVSEIICFVLQWADLWLQWPTHQALLHRWQAHHLPHPHLLWQGSPWQVWWCQGKSSIFFYLWYYFVYYFGGRIHRGVSSHCAKSLLPVMKLYWNYFHFGGWEMRRKGNDELPSMFHFMMMMMIKTACMCVCVCLHCSIYQVVVYSQ